jgi:LuxR family maltose regulon positive regulatory protein
LIDRLNNGQDSKLTLVSAPAGYGKTTLVSSWAKLLKEPVTWLSIDENDNDPNTFLIYFITALQHVKQGFGSDILAALDSSQAPQIEHLRTLLVNEIAEIKRQFTLILDDCHQITNQDIYELLDFLITHQSPEMHLMMIGRVDPMFSLARLRVGGQLTEIRSNDLRFTRMESTVFLNDLMKLDLSLDDITALGTRTEGWIAGLQLAALSLQGREDKHSFIDEFSGVHHHLLDYLVSEVLSHQTDDMRSFLCRTSILNSFTTSLCDATLGINESQKIIQLLDDSNMFLIPLDEKRKWFRYHHLFNDFLKLCLEDEQEEKVFELHRNAAKWYDQNGYTSEAYSHLLLSEDYAEAAKFVEREAKGLLERSELSQLMKWVDLIPEKIVRERPRLSIYHTWALRLSGSRYDVVETRIRDIENVLENFPADQPDLKLGNIYDDPEDELRNLKAHISALKAFQGVYCENFSEAIEMAEKSKSYRPDERFVHSSVEFALGWAHRLSGDLESAYTAFAKSSAISNESGNIYMAVASLCRAAYGQILAGRLYKAESRFLDAERMAVREDGSYYPVVGYAYVYLGGIQYERNNLDAATEYCLQGIELSKRVGLAYDQVAGFANLAKIWIAKGDLSSAQDACKSAWDSSQLMKDYIYTRRWAEDCQVRLWIAQGDQAALNRWLNTTDLRLDEPPNFNHDLDHIIIARAITALGMLDPSSGNIDDALLLLTGLSELAESADWNGKLIEILVLQAKALQAISQKEQALLSVERALSLAEPEGYIRTFVDEGEEVLKLLHILNRDKGSSPYIKTLIAAFNNEDQISTSQLLIEALSPRELDVLRMLATDLSGPEIANEMNIALTTLRFHTRNIYRKLEVNNRRAAIRNAQSLNLV